MIILKELSTNRFYEYKNNKLITYWGNIYNKSCCLKKLIESGQYKISRKKELSDTSIYQNKKGMKRNNLPRIYGN